MTKYSGNSEEEMASLFITSTCQLHPKFFYPVSDRMHNLMHSNEPEPTEYVTLSGSQAEFYIAPINSCFSDMDYFFSKTDELAFSGDFPVLPRDLSGLARTIKCYKFESYESYPGFVRLRFIGEMNYNWIDKKYQFNRSPKTLSNDYKIINMANTVTKHFSEVMKTLPITVSGPAITVKSDIENDLGGDFVWSVWCPQWPREAQSWPKRPRDYGWPTIDTISEVVQNGCHAVYVQHRACKNDELQWRLSFSIPEGILIQSWSQVQQIAYHLLRFFAKRELIQKDCPKEEKVLCTYHFKTLILWTCENISPEWWNSSSAITICSKLLAKFSDWLKRRHCPNYFIPEANLFYQPTSSKMSCLIRKICGFQSSSVLSRWFVENYILPFNETNFEVEGAQPHFIDFMWPLFEFRNASESITLDFTFSLRFDCCHSDCRTAFKQGLTVGLRMSLKDATHRRLVNHDTEMNCRLARLPTLKQILCFTYCDNLLFILEAAYSLGCAEISWDSRLFVECVEAISMQPKMIKSKFHNFPKIYATETSLFQFLQAQNIMQNLTGSNNCSEFKLLSLVSKGFFRKALDHDVSESNGIKPAALAYLAALHFATSEYQQAKRFCMAVLADQNPKKKKESLNAGCLLFIDDIANIVGLYVLQKCITANNLHYISRRLYLDLRLSPEVFAHYLTTLSAEIMDISLELHRDPPHSAFPMDECLKVLQNPTLNILTKSGIHFNATRQSIYRTTDSLIELDDVNMNAPIVRQHFVDVLVEYALENMTSFYNLIHKDYGIQCNTVDCYRASYLYKCRRYDEALQLCERILHEPDLHGDLTELAFANVLLIPPFDHFFDRDVQSLLGFHTLFFLFSPLNDDVRNFEPSAKSAFAHAFARIVCFKRNGLSALLQRPCPIKCQYFIGRHFLASYLKVRCDIDCNHPHDDAMTEIVSMKANLPFEHLILKFLLRNCVFKNKDSTV